MQAIGLFPTPFLTADLELDTAAYTQLSEQLEQRDPWGIRPGGWQGSVIEDPCELITTLVDRVETLSNDVTRDLWQITGDLECQVVGGWCTRNSTDEPIHNNWSHLHPGAFMAWVYYAHIPPNSGDLVLEPPHKFLDYAMPNEQHLAGINPWNAQRHHYTPVQGELIGFPGWISHAAQPNTSDSTRVSYAFNVELVAKSKQARSA
jgi:uncharacterized protein (TIGR02466 family)